MGSAGVQLNWPGDVLDTLRRWPGDLPPLLLHSGRVHERWARWSLLTTPVRWVSFPATAADRDPLAELRQAVAAADDPQAVWVGYVSYDVGRWIERLPSHAAADRGWPVVCFGYCPGHAVYDHASGRWSAMGSWRQSPPALEEPASWLPLAAGPLQRVFTRPQYEQAIARALAYIQAGDIFQVNLAQRLSAELTGAWPLLPRAVYAKLAQVSPAWYGAYLEINQPGEPLRAVASTSPELFLEVDASGGVITRPIKGTRPAWCDPDELRHSEKDQAELHMIVDLLRNDLGRVCRYGSVQVTQPRTIESHPTVHHGVATVEGRLRPDCDRFDLLQATLPGGSITGAPKVRAMEIIDELEPVRRGPYCGAIGVLRGDGSMTLNITIRTMLLENLTPAAGDPEPSDHPTPSRTRVDFSVGGGIVADSQPAAEYDETLDKAEAILRTLGLPRPESS